MASGSIFQRYDLRNIEEWELLEWAWDSMIYMTLLPRNVFLSYRQSSGFRILLAFKLPPCRECDNFQSVWELFAGWRLDKSPNQSRESFTTIAKVSNGRRVKKTFSSPPVISLVPYSFVCPLLCALRLCLLIISPPILKVFLISSLDSIRCRHLRSACDTAYEGRALRSLIDRTNQCVLAEATQMLYHSNVICLRLTTLDMERSPARRLHGVCWAGKRPGLLIPVAVHISFFLLIPHQFNLWPQHHSFRYQNILCFVQSSNVHPVTGLGASWWENQDDLPTLHLIAYISTKGLAWFK